MHHVAQGRLLYGETRKMVLHSAMPVGSGEIANCVDGLLRKGAEKRSMKNLLEIRLCCSVV